MSRLTHCNVIGCERTMDGHTTRGMCMLHYGRWRKNGDAGAVEPSIVRDGRSRLPEYRIWKAIKTRCLNPNADHYERYGGRGIKICERWSLDFASFLTDMGRRPSSKYEIDRIDNDGNYEPGNCRWVTHSVNVANHPSRLSKSGYRGVLIVKSGRFQALISVERVRTCIGTFATADEAAWMYDQYAMCLWPDIDILNLVYEK